MTPADLALACAERVRDLERESRESSVAICIMFEPDPTAPMILVFPLMGSDLESRRGETDLVSILNPAEHREELELTISSEIEAALPRGNQLRELVDAAVKVLRREFPSKLVYMTDPECTELANSVAEATCPASLDWLPCN